MRWIAETSLMMTTAFLALAMLGADLPERRPVVVSTDCGVEVDDQWAIAHLALSPTIDLKGIVTNHAPGLKAPAAARVVADLLKSVGVRNPPPVVAGSSEPLKPDGKPHDNAGVTLLLAEARGRTKDDPLTVVMIGSATDVASALLTDPSWADRVILVAMAFDAWPQGGDLWNVKNDVLAWQIVMRLAGRLVVGDAQVTRRSLAQTPASALASLGDAKPGARHLRMILERWITENPKLAEEASGKPGTWPIWDEVVVAYLLGMTSQEERPRPYLKDDRTFDHSKTTGKIVWITDVATERLWEHLAERL